jgi:hypothetical protein
MNRLASYATVISSLSIIGAMVVVPSQARACEQWDLGGYWEFQLDNGRWVGFSLQQEGKSLSGKAQYWVPRGADGRGPVFRWADGRVEGKEFYLVYPFEEVHDEFVTFKGRVNPDGSLSGIGPDDPNNPNPKQEIGWHEKAGRKATCIKGGAGGSQSQTSTTPSGIKPAPRPGTDLGR